MRCQCIFCKSATTRRQRRLQLSSRMRTLRSLAGFRLQSTKASFPASSAPRFVGPHLGHCTENLHRRGMFDLRRRAAVGVTPASGDERLQAEQIGILKGKRRIHLKKKPVRYFTYSLRIERYSNIHLFGVDVKRILAVRSVIVRLRKGFTKSCSVPTQPGR